MFLSNRTDDTRKLLVSQLANVITLMNLSLGCLAIIFVLKGSLNLSLLMIFLAALLDWSDGKVARNLNITSDFGKQLDSLSDLISFGVAPAILLYESVLNNYHSAGIGLTVIYLLTGAIRLARYNITTYSGSFQGLPITAAGCILAFSYTWIPFVPSFIFLFLILLLSILMISSVKVKKI